MAGDFSLLNEGEKSIQDRQIFNNYCRVYPYAVQDFRHIMDCALCHQKINMILTQILNILGTHIHPTPVGPSSPSADALSLCSSACQPTLTLLTSDPLISPTFTPALKGATPAFIMVGANADIKTMNLLQEGVAVTSPPMNTYGRRVPANIQFTLAGANPASVMRVDGTQPFLYESPV